MLRSQVSQGSLHSSCCRITADGRKNFHRALATGAFLFCLFSMLLVSSVILQAQQVTGAIVVTVSDATGAALSGAKIVARDLDRGTILTTTSNESGAFNIPLVPVGRYEVKAEAKGFQNAANPAFEILLNQTVRISFQMKVGEVSQTVEVAASSPILQTDTSLIGS